MKVDVQLPLSNDQIAVQLDSIGNLLENQGANIFRVRAYRSAASVVKSNQRQISDILAQEGLDGLMNLPGIGISLAHVIEKIANSGHTLLLDRLLKEVEPETSLSTVPGIGNKLAAEIHKNLGIENLHDLEIAAHDGRLAAMPGIGEKRLRAVRESLSGRFHHAPLASPKQKDTFSNSDSVGSEISVAEILSVDTEYNRRVSRHSLPLIAPKRFNPTKSAWLPILHTTQNGHRYTAMYSNTARANELGTQKDWLVIYLDGSDLQWTVVTAHYGRLAGKRIVRGRERECLEYYQRLDAKSAELN